MSNSDLVLSIKTASDLTELTVFDSRQRVVASGLGSLETRLRAGLYQLRAQLGPTIHERLLSIEEDKTIKIEFDDLLYPTPVPLLGSIQRRDYHGEAVSALSWGEPVKKGDGAQLLIFARGWSPDESASGDPLLGLTLHDSAGTELLDLSQNAQRRVEPDVCAGVLVAVDPGPYRLRLKLANGAVRERMLFGVRHWQTQIFFLMRDSGGDRRADIDGGAVVMSQDHFRWAGEGERAAVIARYGLTNDRPITDGVRRVLLRLKFADPILGLLGAHLLLRDAPHDVRLRAEVMGNLRRMLGEDHPDVQALELPDMAGRPPRQLSAPPLLRASWDLATGFSVSHKDFIPEIDAFKEVQTTIQPSMPWLVWQLVASEMAADDAGEDATLDALRGFVQGYQRAARAGQPAPPSPRLISRLIRNLTPRLLGRSLLRSERVAPAAEPPLSDSAKMALARSLGVSGARLDALLDRLGDADSDTGSSSVL